MSHKNICDPLLSLQAELKKIHEFALKFSLAQTGGIKISFYEPFDTFL